MGRAISGNEPSPSSHHHHHHQFSTINHHHHAPIYGACDGDGKGVKGESENAINHQTIEAMGRVKNTSRGMLAALLPQAVAEAVGQGLRFLLVLALLAICRQEIQRTRAACVLRNGDGNSWCAIDGLSNSVFRKGAQIALCSLELLFLPFPPCRQEKASHQGSSSLSASICLE